MAGIYIHIPFCKKACHYCNFHFSTSLRFKKELMEALSTEIEMTSSRTPGGSKYLADELIETIYFGGGTPSLLDEQELENILSLLNKNFAIDPNAEITFEANPDDISPTKLKHWRSMGINRLSIGVQSFFDEHLRWMNRAHGARQSIAAIEEARQEGFYNFSIDLIYGVPIMSEAQWRSNLDQARILDVPHLSSYALTVEPSTALYQMIRQKKRMDVDEEAQATQFSILTDWAAQSGYEQYEISNLAKPGMRSRHNSSYWQGKKYLGLGPSAHSFNGGTRQWNIANNTLYIQSIKENKLPLEMEILTPDQQFNEYVMTSLRTIEGINLTHLEMHFGSDMLGYLIKNARNYLNDGKLINIDNYLKLTGSGKFFADGIAAALFK